jgi:hypothetical protein
LSNQSQESVEPCFRCGQPAEQPAVGCGHVAGQDQEHLPLYVDCLQLLLEDARVFWEGMRRKPAAAIPVPVSPRKPHHRAEYTSTARAVEWKRCCTMGRIILNVVALVGLTLFLILQAGLGVIYPKFAVQAYLLWFAGIGTALAITLSAIVAVIHRIYHLARGRRDREAGIRCVHCQRTAFPIDGTTTAYRCGICRSRFNGPEHF